MITFVRVTRPGSRVYTVAVPKVRLPAIVEEYRLLGWDVDR
jgi:hypothetical protein